MNLSEQYTKLHEAKANPKMIDKMIMAIEKEDEKALLKFMAMDKKNFFSKRNLDSEVEEGNVTEVEAKKLGKLSIGVASALEAIGGDPMKKDANKKMAMERVKEVKSMSESNIDESAVSDSWETKEKEFGDDFFLGSGELENEIAKSKAPAKLIKNLLVESFGANEEKIKKAMESGKPLSVKYKTKVEVLMEMTPEGTFLYKVVL
jgi:hypothetical protein